MGLVYLLLGTNEGDRLRNLQKATKLIEERIGRIAAISSLYETEAWGGIEQGSFLNQAMSAETALPPEELLVRLKAIEQDTGRVSTLRWGPRIIDIDILLLDDIAYQSPTLNIPHLHLAERRFALVPLAEIAGKIVHPVSHTNITEMLAVCPDKMEVTLLP